MPSFGTKIVGLGLNVWSECLQSDTPQVEGWNSYTWCYGLQNENKNIYLFLLFLIQGLGGGGGGGRETKKT